MPKIDVEEYQEMLAEERHEQLMSLLKDSGMQVLLEQQNTAIRTLIANVREVLILVREHKPPVMESVDLTPLANSLKNVENKLIDLKKEEKVEQVEFPKPKSFDIERNAARQIVRVVPRY